jgi:hypothetical protein
MVPAPFPGFRDTVSNFSGAQRAAQLSVFPIRYAVYSLKVLAFGGLGFSSVLDKPKIPDQARATTRNQRFALAS